MTYEEALEEGYDGPPPGWERDHACELGRCHHHPSDPDCNRGEPLEGEED